MYSKNKRSISSCSNYNKQHHSSLISIASDENGLQEKVKRYEYA